MKVITVISNDSISEFLNFPKRLFREDQNYIRPLDQDIEKVFDPKKNKFFKAGFCERFLFKNEENETVGKIAVFVNKKYKQSQPTGGVGFFDCIDDQTIANFIFDFSKSADHKLSINNTRPAIIRKYVRFLFIINLRLRLKVPRCLLLQLLYC